ncbi:phospholipid scramblase 1-like [Corticium candelabrum]|uniref:phospholipid scramblase 1-like n=1 Tax=Corticium candelabrum TaxID=121492 RepID=UPI002E25967C|nr:phospholipid scramblase 1-like [Corticium candelabrum]
MDGKGEVVEAQKPVILQQPLAQQPYYPQTQQPLGQQPYYPQTQQPLAYPSGQQPPMMQQAPPGARPPISLMPPPLAIEGIPPGLEYLAQVDQLLIHQLVEILEMLTGFETENKYVIKNTMGQQVYFAAEKSDCCERQCCGAKRSFSMSIVDNFHREVIHLERPFHCGGCCCPCDLNVLEVQAPPGNVIGYVKEKWTCWYPEYHLTDAQHVKQLFIQGPCCYCKCCQDVHFQILNDQNGTQIGTLTNQWGGCLKEAYTDADNFTLNFPMDMPWQMKAVLLSAAFLIDFMYYEQQQNNRNR